MSKTWLDQLQRVERWLKRIDVDRPERREDYEDFLWSFFQNAWHLVSWINNDDALSSVVRDSVYARALAYDSLRICNALANRTKHLRLTLKPHRPDADLGGAKLKVQVSEGLRSEASRRRSGTGQSSSQMDEQSGRERWPAKRWRTGPR